MPRPRPPPTPSTSIDIPAKERLSTVDMENVFSLPSPAVSMTGAKSTVSKAYIQAISSDQVSPPTSPKDSKSSPLLSRKRTLSESTKSRSNPETAPQLTQDAALPPPPSRARKIIHMKPKPSPGNTNGKNSQFSVKTPSSQNKEAVTSPATTKRKQTQPATTSAAGRKIARKTAHSIIERRRRSKMNEEFGVLKDMIPACTGVEMHKLAILQAGIEYVRYLEDCIEQLKSQNESLQTNHRSTPYTTLGEDDRDGESMDVDSQGRDIHHGTAPSSTAGDEAERLSLAKLPTTTAGFPLHSEKSQSFFNQSSAKTSATNSTTASPDLHPRNPSHTNNFDQHAFRAQESNAHATKIHTSSFSTSSPPVLAQTFTPTGVSPAFGAFHFSPELSRTPTSVSTSTWSSINGPSASTTPQNNPCPSVIFLPQAALPCSGSTSHPVLPPVSGAQAIDTRTNEMCAEATATAALMMMMTRKERRDSKTAVTNANQRISTSENVSRTSSTSGKGMSVRDLLSS